MNLLTERDMIRSVARRWRYQYSKLHNGMPIHPFKLGMLSDLEALNVETCTADDVKDVIGNYSWTELRCEECGNHVKSVVIIGGSLGSKSIYLCLECVAAAHGLISA